jgi:hypothetical protein
MGVIGNTTSGKSFHGLAQYLDGDRSRVEWTAARNLMTNDPQLAATIMRATADRSRFVGQPVYHLSISFAPEDRPTRAQMETVADRLLERLGLQQREAILVAHNDTGHAHLHIMVNRVHPETGLAWNRWRDRPVIERTCRELERELGFRFTPGRLYRDAEHPRPDLALPRTITSGERRQREHGVEPLIERVRPLAPELLAARSWEELAARLATHGLTLHRKYTGIVISDGETQVKASRVAQDLSLRNCERRFHERFPDRLAPPDIERVADAVRTLGTHESLMARVRAAGDELVRARSALAVGERTHAPVGALEVLRGRVREAESTVAATRAALTEHAVRSQPSPDLRRTIGLAVDRMLPHELRLFQRLVAPPELALAQWCRSQVRELLRERSEPAFS